MKIVITKIEKFPQELPTNTNVAFLVTFDNDRTFEVGALVDLKLSEEEAVPAAWEIVKNSVEEKQKTIGALPKLVGSVFTPPVVEEVVEEETPSTVEEEEIIEE